MQAMLDDADMSAVLAVSYTQNSTEQHILSGLAVLLSTSHTLRKSRFVRQVLQIVANRCRLANVPSKLARVASMYLNLAVTDPAHRCNYVRAANGYFDLFPPRQAVLWAFKHETRYWAGVRRHVDAVVAGSGIMHVMAQHFRRKKHDVSWLPENTKALLSQDSQTFSCGVLGVLRCISILDHYSSVLPCQMSADFCLHVVQGILENTRFFLLHPLLYVPTTLLLGTLCPKACVEVVLDHLFFHLCATVVGGLAATEPPQSIQCLGDDDGNDGDNADDGWHEPGQAHVPHRQLCENTLSQCIEHMVSRVDIARNTANYLAIKPCVFDLVSAAAEIVPKPRAACRSDEGYNNTKRQLDPPRTQTHMNVCCLVGTLLQRSSTVADKEVRVILGYVQHLADASLLCTMSFSIVSVLSRLVFMLSDGGHVFIPSVLQHLLELLNTIVGISGNRMCSEEVMTVVRECVVCILAKQQTQLSLEAWDVMADICTHQIEHKQVLNLPLPDGLIESIIVVAQNTSEKTFGAILVRMKNIYERFGPVTSMATRTRRHLIDLLKIPLCRGVFMPKAQLRLLFADIGLVGHAEGLARLFVRLDNSRGRHTCSMLSVVHTLFLLILFQAPGYATKDTTLRLCAKIMSSPNVRETQRVRTLTMVVELLGRYHHCAANNNNTSLSPICSVLVRHLIHTLIPHPLHIVYSEVPLVLCIISSLLSHRRLVCLCEATDKPEAPGAIACAEIYVFCGNALGNLHAMAATPVHRHGLLLIQRILHSLLTSQMHCDVVAAQKLPVLVLLQRLQALRQFMITKAEVFHDAAHSSGLIENAALLMLVNARASGVKASTAPMCM